MKLSKTKYIGKLLPMYQKGGAWVNNMYFNPNLNLQSSAIQILSKPLDQGYNQQLQNANLNLNIDQGLRADKQLKLQEDNQKIREEQFKIANDLAERKFKELQKQNELNNTLNEVKLQQSYADSMGFDILPEYQDKMNQLKSKYNVEIPSEISGYKEAYVNLQKLKNDKEFKEIILQSALHKKLAEEYGQLYDKAMTVLSDPQKSQYYNRDEIVTELNAGLKDIKSFGQLNPSQALHAYEKLKHKPIELFSKFSEEGYNKIKLQKELDNAKLLEAQSKIEESKLKSEYNTLKLNVIKNELSNASTPEEKMKILNQYFSKSSNGIKPNQYTMAYELVKNGEAETLVDALAIITNAQSKNKTNDTLSTHSIVNIGLGNKQIKVALGTLNGVKIGDSKVTIDKNQGYIVIPNAITDAGANFINKYHLEDIGQWFYNSSYESQIKDKLNDPDSPLFGGKLLNDGSLIIPINQQNNEYGNESNNDIKQNNEYRNGSTNNVKGNNIDQTALLKANINKNKIININAILPPIKNRVPGRKNSGWYTGNPLNVNRRTNNQFAINFDKGERAVFLKRDSNGNITPSYKKGFNYGLEQIRKYLDGRSNHTNSNTTFEELYKGIYAESGNSEHVNIIINKLKQLSGIDISPKSTMGELNRIFAGDKIKYLGLAITAVENPEMYQPMVNLILGSKSKTSKSKWVR